MALKKTLWQLDFAAKPTIGGILCIPPRPITTSKWFKSCRRTRQPQSTQPTMEEVRNQNPTSNKHYFQRGQPHQPSQDDFRDQIFDPRVAEQIQACSTNGTHPSDWKMTPTMLPKNPTSLQQQKSVVEKCKFFDPTKNSTLFGPWWNLKLPPFNFLGVFRQVTPYPKT